MRDFQTNSLNPEGKGDPRIFQQLYEMDREVQNKVCSTRAYLGKMTNKNTRDKLFEEISTPEINSIGTMCMLVHFR
ncbi:Uncharacterized protein HZ326_28291 [Fusarium oxysporum f. sp. albedinis]|nr:Uncharacterized protein HZ326_28291 [Fusarium oxysporum f. sp. albedinis]